MTRTISSRRPYVFFLDDDGWASFDQVAAMLRRRGITTVRLTAKPAPGVTSLFRKPRFRWLTDRACYDEVLVLSSEAGAERTHALLQSGMVGDVIATEPTLQRIRLDSAACRRLSRHSLACRKLRPSTLLDKFAVNDLLAQGGVDVPRQISGDGADPVQVGGNLGYPLLVKSKVGAGGDQVRLAKNPVELARAVEELGGPGPGVFYQEHISGRLVLYAGVVGEAGAIMDHGFLVKETQSPLGPSAVVDLYDKGPLLAAGRRVAELLGCRGFVSFGFIETSDGRLAHIDANCRIWGMILAPLQCGIDFTAPYAAMIQHRCRAGARRVEAVQQLPVFPFALMEVFAKGRLTEALAATRRFLRVHWQAVGPAYCGLVVLQAGVVAAARWRRALHRDLSTGRQRGGRRAVGVFQRLGPT